MHAFMRMMQVLKASNHNNMHASSQNFPFPFAFGIYFFDDELLQFLPIGNITG